MTSIDRSDQTDQTDPTGPTGPAGPAQGKPVLQEDIEQLSDPSGAATRAQVRREQVRLLAKSPGFILGMVVLLFWVVAAVAPDLVTSRTPDETVRDAEGLAVVSSGPSGEAWFGTDRLGRDVYTRVIHGARPIMVAAPLAAAIAALVGTFLGLITGYARGWLDEIIGRIVEALMSIPVILLAIVIVFTFGRTTPIIIATVAVLFIPPVTRTVRAATLAEAELDYVTSAQMRGESSAFIVMREILPNVVGVIVVELTVRLGYAVFTLATLAFLSITANNLTTADWGVDVSQNYSEINSSVWWPTIFPAMAIASLVIAVNLVADSVEKATSS